MVNLEKILAHRLDDNKMNSELENLYSEILQDYAPMWWAHYLRQTDPELGDYPANPYLLSAPDYYANSKHRIMMVGQDTYSWGGEWGDCGAFHAERTVQELMCLYDICYKERSVSTLLWRFGRSIEEEVGVPLIFNNVAKAGWCGKRGFEPRLQPRCLSREISILSPDIIIFATGPTRPYMKELEANGYSPSVLNRVPLLTSNGYNFVEKWDGSDIPIIWCCHPRYLQTKEVFERAVSIISEVIRAIV